MLFPAFSFLLLYAISLSFALKASDLAFSSQDFVSNISLLSNPTVEIAFTKSPFYLLYEVFKYNIEPNLFLFLLWSFLPPILIYVSLRLLFFLLPVKKRDTPIFLILISLYTFYIVLFRSFSIGTYIPTMHLLFQSLSSGFAALGILNWNHRRPLSVGFAFLSVTLHLSTIFLILFSILSRILIKASLINNRFSFSRGFILKFASVFLQFVIISFSSLYSIIFFRGLDVSVDTLGVTSNLYAVILISTALSLTVTALFFVNTASLTDTSAFINFTKSDFHALFLSLAFLSLDSQIASTLNLGVAYRLSYPVYVLSPVLILALVFLFFRLIFLSHRSNQSSY